MYGYHETENVKIRLKLWPETNPGRGDGDKINPLSTNSRSNANFSFPFIASYVLQYGELGRWSLVWVNVCLSTKFIRFVRGRLGELRSSYLGLKGWFTRTTQAQAQEKVRENRGDASTSTSVRRRKAFLFLTLALVLASSRFTRTFSCAYACACAYACVVRVNQL